MRRPTRQTPDGQRSGDGSFLPDFCNIRIVFAIVVVAELLAFILALAPQGRSAASWSDLSLISLLIQWAALSCTAVLCLCRPWLSGLRDAWAASAGYGVILAVVAVVSELAYRLGRGTGLEYLLPQGWHWQFLVRNVAIGAIVGAVILRYFYVQRQWQRHIEAEARARFQALQARIRPHFMFNSMNTIASLTRSRPELAEEVVEDLAELFRASLAEAGNLTTLGAELDLTRRYLHIEALRLGERLKVEWRTAGLPLGVRVPALLVQPLVENAIYHGVETIPEGGTITIEGGRAGDALAIRVANPRPQGGHAERRHGHHMALDNIRERLALHYGAQGRLEIDGDECEYSVRLTIPGEGART